MHPTEGQLQAYRDGELTAAEAEQLAAHLTTCPTCQQRAQDQADRAGRVRRYLTFLKPPQPPPTPLARARLRTLLARQENQTMFQKLFTPRFRIAWVALAILAALAIGLAFPSVRAIANSFLGLFRVQQVAVVPINPANLPDEVAAAEEQITQLLADDVQMTEIGEERSPVTVEEASTLLGMTVRLPQTAEPAVLSVQPGINLNAKVNLARLRAILAELGRNDIQLPDSLEGATLSAVLPPSLTALYGDCATTPTSGTDPDEPSPQSTTCTALTQLATPSVSAPAGLDVTAIGQAYLQMIGMDAEDAANFSAAVDWSSTLVLPIPSDASYFAVPVDGVTGSLIQQSAENKYNPRYMLIWIKNDVLYALSGRGDPQTAVEMANTMK